MKAASTPNLALSVGHLTYNFPVDNAELCQGTPKGRTGSETHFWSIKPPVPIQNVLVFR